MQHIEQAIDLAQKRDYIGFEKALKQEVDHRIINDPYIKKRYEELTKYKEITSLYSKIGAVSKDLE